MAINYPSYLPAPLVSVISEDEARQLSDESRPLYARAQSTDFIEYERLEFPAMNRNQADQFNQFWQVDLVYGGAWFNATWPLPRGLVEAVRKFIAPPRWVYKGNGYWKITATCEVRRRSVPVIAVPQAYSPWNAITASGQDPETLESYWTFTNSDNTATGRAGEANVVSRDSVTSGNRYGEIQLAFDSYPIGLAYVVAGISRNNPESPRDSVAVSISGIAWVEGSFYSEIDPIVDGDTVGVAVETATGKVWLSVNGIWLLGGSPDTLTGEIATLGPGEFWLGFGLSSAIDALFTATLRATTPFQYSPPAGFTAWYTP